MEPTGAVAPESNGWLKYVSKCTSHIHTCVFVFVAPSGGVVERERDPMLDLLAELRGLPAGLSLSVLMRSRFTGLYDLFRPRADKGGGRDGEEHGSGIRTTLTIDAASILGEYGSSFLV